MNNLSNIIINTDNLYAELPADYTSLNIYLSPVSLYDTSRIVAEHVNQAVRSISTPYIHHTQGPQYAELCKPTGYVESPISSSEFENKILYEVNINWERRIPLPKTSTQQNHQDWDHSTGSFRVHGLSLDEAREEKKIITKQIVEKHNAVQLVKDYLFDEGSAALGLLGEGFKREIATIVCRYKREQLNDQ